MASKTTFYLEKIGGGWTQNADIKIIGQAPSNKPYVNIEVVSMAGVRTVLGIQDKDLERFAVNILKALGSKKLAK